MSFLYRAAHLAKVAAILDDPEASPNDRGVALALLRNAAVAAGFKLPMCQDTGTATIIGKKGQRVWTGGVKDEEWLSRGVFETYQKENLRYSQTIPAVDVRRDQLRHQPAGPDRHLRDARAGRTSSCSSPRGAGRPTSRCSSRRPRPLLNPASLEKFLKEKLRSLGTAACPPYHLAVVIGGTSAEATMKTVKLASTGYLDKLPTQGNKLGQAFRDLELEEKVMELARKSGIGAQFGGKYFALDARVIRLPRHGASCPVGNRRLVLGRPQHQGADRPRRDLARRAGARPGPVHPGAVPLGPGPQARRCRSTSTGRWRRSSPSSRSTRSRTPLRLTGTIIVARDIAHAQDQGAARPRRGDARLFQATIRSTTPVPPRRPTECPRLVRPHHRRPDGQLRRPVPVRRGDR